MDMMMPVMGGVEATRAIRVLELAAASAHTAAREGTAPYTLRVPILAMTANASNRDRDECRVAGMDGFLSKPVLKDRLAEAILQASSMALAH